MYNLIVRRGTTQQEFYALAEEIRKKNVDKSTKFRATIERVLVNMKIISVKDVSDEAFAYLKNH